MSSSSLPVANERLVRVRLDRLHAHPQNPNRMSEERLEKLARNIEREHRYPPLVARPHPERDGEWQLLDGHQRAEVLSRLGHDEATVYPWACDDETALLLLATLNRLEGEDLPAARAELFAELTGLVPAADLALLVPEDAASIDELLGLLEVDTEALLAELEQQVEKAEGAGHRVISFAVTPADEEVVEEAIARLASEIEGKNRRGQALVALCRGYLEAADDR